MSVLYLNRCAGVCRSASDHREGSGSELWPGPPGGDRQAAAGVRGHGAGRGAGHQDRRSPGAPRCGHR